MKLTSKVLRAIADQIDAGMCGDLSDENVAKIANEIGVFNSSEMLRLAEAIGLLNQRVVELENKESECKIIDIHKGKTNY